MRRLGVLSAIVCLCAIHAAADEEIDLQMISRIKAEGIGNSKVMDTLSDLVDRHGSRLAGSTNHQAAAEWCRDAMKGWGLENAALESMGKIGRGWQLKRFHAEMLEPYYLNLIAVPKAWTGSTDGIISGTPLLVSITTADDIKKYEGQLKGAIVLYGEPNAPEPGFEPDAKRYTAEGLEELSKASLGGAARRPPTGTPAAASQPQRDPAALRARRGLRERMNEAFRKEGVGCVLEASRSSDGTVFVQGGGSREPNDPEAPASLVVAAEHYGLVARLLKKKVAVKLEVGVEAKFTDGEVEDFNVVAEIPGTDPKLKDEVVMLGGHLDSWHSATGTTDNAAGCVVAMEAVRILKAIDAKPRRTIRVALWTGEEEGLLGSAAYVKAHFADRNTMELKPEHGRFAGYFNLDNGVGRIRGIYCQSNDAVRPIFEEWLTPFHDMDAKTVTVRNTGGTDHQSFDGVGLPGFQFLQDQMDYDSRTHHSNMDLYERAVPDDLKQASVIMASFVYNAAMRDEKLPRKELPKARRQRGEGREGGPSERDGETPSSRPAGELPADHP